MRWFSQILQLSRWTWWTTYTYKYIILFKSKRRWSTVLIFPNFCGLQFSEVLFKLSHFFLQPRPHRFSISIRAILHQWNQMPSVPVYCLLPPMISSFCARLFPSSTCQGRWAHEFRDELQRTTRTRDNRCYFPWSFGNWKSVDGTAGCGCEKWKSISKKRKNRVTASSTRTSHKLDI